MLFGKEPEGIKKGKTRAIITDTGDLIRIEKSSDTTGETTKLPQDLWGLHYKSGKCARPPYEPGELIQLLETNTYHYKCVKQKALDTVGAYSVVEIDKEKDKKSGKDKKLVAEKQGSEKGRQGMLDFLDNCNNILGFRQIAKALMMDYEAVGWMVLEVIRNRGGEIIKLNHIPASTCRFLLDGTGMVHRRLYQERIFKFFGDEEERIDPNTNLPCNEVIYRFDYSLRSDYYGIPDYIPSVGAMLANSEIRDYNIKFFENGAVPQYAVVLEGGELDEGTEEVIKSHFRDNLKGSQNAHKTLVISAPDGGKVHFEPLQVEIKDGHFRLYGKDNRDEIISAHGVPPYRIGIAETGSLGGNVAQEMTEIYKQSVITPRQYMMEDVFSKLFGDESFKGRGFDGWKLEFDEIDTNDEKLEAEIAEIRIRTAKNAKDTGTFTPDEVRDIGGFDPLSEEDGMDEDIKDWATVPMGYEAPQEAPEGEGLPGEQMGQDGNQIPPEEQGDGTNGGSNNLDQYNDILNNYRKDGNIRKSIKNIKKKFSIQSERIKESINKGFGPVEILKSKFSRKSKKVADSEREIEEKFKDRLINMFDDMKIKVEIVLSDLDFRNSKIEKSDYDKMLENDEFNSLFPEIFKQVSDIMSPVRLTEVMYEMMVSGIEFGLSDALELARGTNYTKNINWKLYDKNVSKFLDEYTFKASKKTMNRLTGNVMKQIKEAQERGESIQEIMSRLDNVFKGLTGYEAERIARTETIKSSNAGRFESYKAMDVQKKVWLGRDDGRERDSHIELNYEIVPMNEPFSNGLMYPGDPDGPPEEVINCRCAIGAIFPENEELYGIKYRNK